MRSRCMRLARWLLFGIGVALAPIVGRYLILRTYHLPATLEAVISNGELLLISTGIAAGGIGEIIASGQRHGLLKVLAAGTFMLFALASSFYFSALVLPQPDTAYITSVSVKLFVGTNLASGMCLTLGQEEAKP